MLSVKHKSSGFTLIELLIVIAIIGVLATILLANFIGVRQRARDAQRKADLRQIQGAIELYKADQGVYPPTILPYVLNTADCPTSSPLAYPRTGTPTVTYMARIPCDPSSIQFWNLTPGNYYYTLIGSTYGIAACIENGNETGSNIYASLTACASSHHKYYYVTNP